MKKQSFSLALCGVFGALSIVIMLLGVIIPIAMYIAPALAALLVMIALEECGSKMAWTLYGAVSMISLLFVPDKELAFVYVFLLGYYPLIKPRFDAIRRGWVRVLAKLGFFNLALAVAYGVLMLLLFPGWMSMQWNLVEILTTAAIWGMGNLSFYLFDKAMVLLLQLYRLVWKRRLHRMLRH